MSFFSAIEGWFHKEQTSLNKIFKRIEPLIAKAEPIVKEVSLLAAEVGQPPVLAPVAAFLNKVIPDVEVVHTFVAANETAPLNSILHNAAALALQYTHGSAATTISDIDTAVQLAYSAVKEAAPAPETSTVIPPAAPAAPAPVVPAS